MELLETVDKVTQLSRILLWRYISVLLFFALHKHKMLMFLWTKCYESRLHCLTIFHRLHFRSHSELLHQWVLLSNHCIFFVVCVCEYISSCAMYHNNVVGFYSLHFQLILSLSMETIPTSKLISFLLKHRALCHRNHSWHFSYWEQEQPHQPISGENEIERGRGFIIVESLSCNLGAQRKQQRKVSKG